MDELLKVGTKVKLMRDVNVGGVRIKKGSECVIEYVDSYSFSPYYSHCNGVSVWLSSEQIEEVVEV